MNHKLFKSIILVAAIMVFCSTCTQDTGTSPYDCSKTQAFFVLKPQNKDKPGNLSIQDTVGDSISFGFNTTLPLNVDSIEIRKATAFDTIGAFITTVKDIQSRKAVDTIWNSLQLTDTGTIYLKCKAYLVCGLKLSAIASVTILPRPANHPPKLLVPRLINLHPGDSCTLGVLASDADNYQTLTISSLKIPPGSSFDPQSRLFTWKIPGSFTGVDSVVLKVQDNGYPPLFDQKTVYLNVQTIFANHKPVLSVRGMRNIRPADTCTLLVNASDPDSLQTVTVSMLSGPKGAVLKDSIFTWAPPAIFIGTDSAKFIAKDDGLPPQSDTVKVYINVASNIPVPSRPEGFKIVSRVNGWVNLNWKVSSVADFYTIFRYSMKHGLTFVAVDTVYDTLYKDFIGSMNCQYYVKAYNKSGESPSSDTVVSLNSNLPPQWQKDTVNLLGTVGQTLTLTASTLCLDPNGDTITFSLLSGQPVGDTLIKGVYSFTPNASDTGVFWPRIVAKDPQGLSDTLTIHLTVSAVAPTNHKPVLIVNGARNIKSGATCTLAASATDPDSAQVLTYSMKKKPSGSTFDTASKTFTWKTPSTFKGIDTALFFVADNGTPAMYDSVIVAILVSDTVINHPPKWQADTFKLTVAAGNALQLTLADKCTDPDGDKLYLSLLSGKPAGDTVKTGVYSFTPAAADTGIFWPLVVVKDSLGLADTLTLRLVVIAPDQKAPDIKLFSPTPDSSTVSTGSVTVKVVCKDSSGVASVKCSMGTDTFTVTNTDSIYSASVTGLKSTAVNEILFIATDKSVNANRDTLKVHVKYAPVIDLFTVNYEANFATTGSVPMDSGHYKTGAKVTVLGNTGVLTRTGYTFAGWNTKDDGSGTSYASADTFTMGTSNVTLYARWTQKTTFTLTITAANGSVTKSPSATAYDSGTVVTLTPVPANGYHFSGWSGALTGSTNPGTVTMNSAKSVTATFAINPPNTFSLSVLATNGTVKKTPDQPQYDSGSSVGLKATANIGYHFVNWSGDASGTTDSTTILMAAAKNVTANFAINTYALTITAANGSVTKSPNLAQYDSGTIVSLTAVPAAGYSFTGWSGGLTGTTNPTSITMNTAKTVTASFIATYTVIFNANGGSPTPSNQTIATGGYATKPSDPTLSGYTFAGWYNGSTQWNFTSNAVSSNVTLTAKWEVRDVDGNVYTTVTINGKVWMVENLRTTHFRNGNTIQYVSDMSTWSGLYSTSAYCWYNFDAANAGPYGALYNGYAASDYRKLAPAGWHVATSADWDDLVSLTGDVTTVGQVLKDVNYWEPSGYPGNNSSGFSARAGGELRSATGSFLQFNSTGNWWTSDGAKSLMSYNYRLWDGEQEIANGYSVRCVLGE